MLVSLVCPTKLLFMIVRKALLCVIFFGQDNSYIRNAISSLVSESSHHIMTVTIAAPIPMTTLLPNSPPFIEGEKKRYAPSFSISLVSFVFCIDTALICHHTSTRRGIFFWKPARLLLMPTFVPERSSRVVGTGGKSLSVISLSGSPASAGMGASGSRCTRS